MITKKTESSQNPVKLLIFSPPKIGKTTLAAALPNSLIVDLEDGSNYIEGDVYNVIREAVKQNVTQGTAIYNLAQHLRTLKTRYDYIVLDTITGLENIARQGATALYKSTNIGKDFKGRDVVMELPQGGGYEWLRQAFQMLMDQFDGLYNKSLILFGHFKNSSIMKDGKDMTAKDVALTGKLKLIVSSNMDAVGFMFRNKATNQNILSFKSTETDLVTGARPLHLRGQEFIISELVDDKIVTHWDKVFIS